MNFGYPWWLSYGHLVVFCLALATAGIGWKLRWSRIPMIAIGVFAIWSFAAFVVARFVMDLNGRASMPTQNFLVKGTGRVLDIGAGTGRSSIMILDARPQITLVALDLFGESYEHHFGPGQSPQERLRANLKLAGVDNRAVIQQADMRKIPFPDQSFDGIVSAYAVDHLNRDGIAQALAEASRVLKPQGEFLLMVVGKDPWLQFTFGPLLMHSGLRGAEWWKARLEAAGFLVSEHGMRPGTLYLVAKRI
jgi:SAM-dependent methyltransferase